jgi:D-3-phosphoglycerate dehydrogenase
MKRIVVTDSTFKALSHEQAVADRHGAILAAFQCRTAEDVIAAVEGADAVFVQFAAVTEAALARLAPGAPIVRYGVGFDNIDLPAARRLGHPVAYVPDYCVDEVADHTVAMLLSLYRKLPTLDASVRSGSWTAVAVSRPLKPASDTVVGFLGLGRVGRAVLARLRPFGFQVLVADPMLDAEAATGLGVGRTDFDDMLPRADIVLLHAPLTKATHKIVNAASLARIKPGAVIVNCSRGALIDEAAIARSLIEGHLAGAALDVFAIEPLPAESPLRTAPNLLLTPHAAWYSDAAMDTLQSLAADEIDRALSGRPPRCPVQ